MTRRSISIAMYNNTPLYLCNKRTHLQNMGKIAIGIKGMETLTLKKHASSNVRLVIVNKSNSCTKPQGELFPCGSDLKQGTLRISPGI